MKIIITEGQSKGLVSNLANIAHGVTDPEGPFKDITEPIAGMGSNLETTAPNLMGFLKSMKDNSLSGTVEKISNVVSGAKDKMSGKEFAKEIPNGDQPMHPLGHKEPISSQYGQRVAPLKGASTNHQGIDISTPSGSKVYAPLDGTVVSSRDTTPNACGGFIQLSHAMAKTKFCHLSKMFVKQGDKVKKGQVIGLTGGGLRDPMHGNSTGPHLHYEVLGRDDTAMNPTQFQHNLA